MREIFGFDFDNVEFGRFAFKDKIEVKWKKKPATYKNVKAFRKNPA